MVKVFALFFKKCGNSVRDGNLRKRNGLLNYLSRI